VGRGDPSIPAQIRDAVFDAPKPTAKPVYRALKLDNGGAAVVAITKLRTDSPDSNKTLQASEAQQEAMRWGTSDALAYVEQVRRTADVRKNPKAFE
jgi:hypothetical protein